MKLTIQASCGCNKGRIRYNNEDNFYFDRKCLQAENNGLKYPVSFEDSLRNRTMMAVFDGMGGENFGEVAAFTAARKLQTSEKSIADYFVSEKTYLKKLTAQINAEVVKEMNNRCTSRMGSTMVALSFSSRYVYVCNVGDSKAFRLRDNAFLQISEDHVDKRPGRETKKAPLTQHLGIDPEEMVIEPYIAKGELKKGDMYLICSDGLTDMLTNFEITDIMLSCEDTESCVNTLIQRALERGGRDNVTVIVAKII